MSCLLYKVQKILKYLKRQIIPRYLVTEITDVNILAYFLALLFFSIQWFFFCFTNGIKLTGSFRFFYFFTRCVNISFAMNCSSETKHHAVRCSTKWACHRGSWVFLLFRGFIITLLSLPPGFKLGSFTLARSFCVLQSANGCGIIR